MTSNTPREILIATSNPHKVEEFRGELEPLGFRVLCLADIPGAAGLAEPDEDAPTFEGNAEIKATYYAQRLNRIALADDSGLEVDALNGEPGIRSARYAGIGGDRATRDAANNAKLLSAIARTPEHQRTARFVCAVCLADPDARVLATARGTFEGRITTSPRGGNGFGYDPLLELEDGRTAAELSPQEKNARSHRGQAARALAAALRRA
ncbi:MAG: RdgB/HAM1 family non-canonical purine NTP pyrophosphatase [Phycisphaerales bacterium]